MVLLMVSLCNTHQFSHRSSSRLVECLLLPLARAGYTSREFMITKTWDPHLEDVKSPCASWPLRRVIAPSPCRPTALWRTWSWTTQGRYGRHGGDAFNGRTTVAVATVLAIGSERRGLVWGKCWWTWNQAGNWWNLFFLNFKMIQDAWLTCPGCLAERWGADPSQQGGHSWDDAISFQDVPWCTLSCYHLVI